MDITRLRNWDRNRCQNRISHCIRSAIPISTSCPPEWAGRFTPAYRPKFVGRGTLRSWVKSCAGRSVGVGCIVDSCKHCEECEDGLETTVITMTGTYNSPTPDELAILPSGYLQQIVVHERYKVLRIRHPQEQLAAVAPLLCRITTYRRYVTGRPGRKKWAWSASAVWGHIWGSSSTRWGACGGIYHF